MDLLWGYLMVVGGVFLVESDDSDPLHALLMAVAWPLIIGTLAVLAVAALAVCAKDAVVWLWLKARGE